jgi:DNA invertase Pin-like site-specific DNA recombinase
VVWKLDRLGRSLKELLELMGELHNRGVDCMSRCPQVCCMKHKSARGRWPAALKPVPIDGRLTVGK